MDDFFNHRRNERQKIARRKQFLRKYGLSEITYDLLLKKQKRQCGICLSDFNEDSGRGICIDHDHLTGKVRGLLCQVCNIRIGVLEDKSWCIKGFSYLMGDLNENL